MKEKNLGPLIMTLPDDAICDILGIVADKSKPRTRDNVLRYANENRLELPDFRARQEELRTQSEFASLRQKAGNERARQRREDKERQSRAAEARQAELERVYEEHQKRAIEASKTKTPSGAGVPNGDKRDDQTGRPI